MKLILFLSVGCIAIASNIASRKLWHDYQSSFYGAWTNLVLILLGVVLFCLL